MRFNWSEFISSHSLIANIIFFRPRLPLARFCDNLLADHDRRTPITCNKCGANLHIFNKTTMWRIAIGHACNHLGRRLFLCCICNFGATYEDSMRNHIYGQHGLGEFKENVIDKSAEYTDDIKAWLRKCFEKNNFGDNNGVSDKVFRYGNCLCGKTY